MMGFDRRTASKTFTAVLVLTFLYCLYLARTTVFVFVLALLFAYLLSPLVNLLDRLLPGSRTSKAALALAYILFMGAVAAVGSLIGSAVVDQATALARQAPAMLASLEKTLTPPQNAAPDSFQAQALDALRSQVVTRSAELLNSLPTYVPKILAAASGLIYLIVIPILGFFFLKDGAEIRSHAIDLAEGRARTFLDDLLADIHLLLAHYMRALVGLALVAFTADSIFFEIIGVPYPILLAAIGGILEFIPMVGPLAAGAIIVAVAAVGGAHVVTVLIFLLAFRLVQDYVISPQLMGQGVELHPLLVIFGVFAGAEIAGIRGSFLSVPLIAMSRVFYVRLRRRRKAIAAPGELPPEGGPGPTIIPSS